MNDQIRYLEPDWFTVNVFNRAVRRLTLLGISVWGSRELRVRGRTTGEWRTTPVNPISRFVPTAAQSRSTSVPMLVAEPEERLNASPPPWACSRASTSATGLREDSCF